MVQVVIGEMRGEGVRMGCRCFWDADTDNYADESYRNVRGCRSRSRSLCSPAACIRLPRSRRRTADRCAFSRPQDSLFCVAAAFGVYLY